MCRVPVNKVATGFGSGSFSTNELELRSRVWPVACRSSSQKERLITWNDWIGAWAAESSVIKCIVMLAEHEKQENKRQYQVPR